MGRYIFSSFFLDIFPFGNVSMLPLALGRSSKAAISKDLINDLLSGCFTITVRYVTLQQRRAAALLASFSEHISSCACALVISYSQKWENYLFLSIAHLVTKCWKTAFRVKAEVARLHHRREKMLFAFKGLRNISLASLSAECQDSVCKQSVHVRVVTWRKLLSCCPRRLTPEVNPDINT